MKNENHAKRIWVIRAGKSGKAHDLFIHSSVIALADSGLGNLLDIDNTRIAFYELYRKLHPEETRTGSSGVAGKYYRFIHEVKVGDYVIYPALAEKHVYLGIINTEYFFKSESDYPHQRFVKWEYIIPKTELSKKAHYEIGAARTFFEFKNNTQEILDKLRKPIEKLFSI